MRPNIRYSKMEETRMIHLESKDGVLFTLLHCEYVNDKISWLCHFTICELGFRVEYLKKETREELAKQKADDEKLVKIGEKK